MYARTRRAATVASLVTARLGRCDRSPSASSTRSPARAPGPLECWVGPPGRGSPSGTGAGSPPRARPTSGSSARPPDDTPFGRRLRGLVRSRATGRARRPRLRLDPARDAPRPARPGPCRGGPATVGARQQPLLGRRRRDRLGDRGARRPARPARRQRAAALARRGPGLVASTTSAAAGGSASTSTARSTSCSPATRRRRVPGGGAGRHEPRPRSDRRDPGRRGRPARRAAGRRPHLGRDAGLARAAHGLADAGIRRGARPPHANGRVSGRRPRSSAPLLERDGPGSLGTHLAPLARRAPSSTAGCCSRTGSGADERAWPPAEDRFASDLLLADAIADPWLRDLTRAGRATRRSRSCSAATPWSARACGSSSAALATAGRWSPCPALRRDPRPDLDAVGQDEALAARIRAEIERDGPITVRPVHGARAVRPGRRLLPRDGGPAGPRRRLPDRAGDASDLRRRRWPALLEDVWERLGRAATRSSCASTAPGPGRWSLAILDRLDRDGIAAARRPRATTRSRSSPAGSTTIAARLAERRRGRPAARSRRPTRDRSPGSSSPTRSSTPCPIAPRRRRRGDRLRRDRRSASTDGAFVDVEAEPSTPALAGAPRRRGDRRSSTASAPRSASRSTAGWRTTAAGLERGLLLLIDYGYPAAELYDPVRRRDGTLRAYLRHRASTTIRTATSGGRT